MIAPNAATKAAARIFCLPWIRGGRHLRTQLVNRYQHHPGVNAAAGVEAAGCGTVLVSEYPDLPMQPQQYS